MNSANWSLIKTLLKDNFDTWKLQVQAVLINNDTWHCEYGKIVKESISDGDITSNHRV